MTQHTLQTELVNAWTQVYEGTSDALSWIARVRASAPRLDSEANDLNLQLYRSKNLARSLARVAGTPMTVGFFGLSQAGKSYLISALAADSNGQLLTDMGGEQLNFIQHVNPTGLGKEATGLVTRFSRQAKASPDPAYPVELRLFNEVEVAMILANAWLNDFDQEQIGYEIDEKLIQEHLQAFSDVDHKALQTGVTPEDIVALADYIGEKRSVAKLKHVYWPKAIQIAPRLDLCQRAQLFSILWGKQPRMTDTYVQLAQTLQQLGSATKVYAPLSVLVQKTENGYAQQNSIMNVDTLNLLGTPNDIAVQVRPCANNELQAPQTIHTAQLTALTSEMTFALVAPPSDPVVEKVDLLDFPGYRARLKMPNLAPLTEQKDIISQLLLRGKVAYLFERYTNSQEMNALIMCTNSTKQSEVVDVDQVLSEWIDKTQGATANDRAKRQPGLLWALTMMDNFIKDASEVDTSQHPISCSNLLHITMLERFGKSDWMQNWNGKAFNNAYLVRKPRLRTTFLELDNNQSEVTIMPGAQNALDALRHSFIANETVQKHVDSPAEAWDGLMALNDGGITRLGQGVAKLADPSFKLERIREQLDDIRTQVNNDLGQWYHQDADDAEGVQKAKAQLIIPNLSQVGDQIGELMHLLSLDDTSVRNLYLSGAYDNEDAATTSSAAAPSPSAAPRNTAIDLSALGMDLDFSTPADDNLAANTVAPSSHEQRFASAVFSAWTAHLRTLTRKDSPLQQLGIPNFESVVPALIEELITASSRKNLATTIQELVLQRAQSGTRREQMAQRYVLIAQLAIQDFIAHLGFISSPAETRPQIQGNAAFDFHAPLASGELPTLADQATPPYQQFSQHWLLSLYHTIMENAGHSAGREIDMAQNSELGTVLKKFGIL